MKAISRHLGNIAKQHWLIWVLIAWPLLTAHLLSQRTYQNSVSYFGEAPQYHTLAVNMLRGHGYINGYVDPMESYKMDVPTSVRGKNYHEDMTHNADYRFNHTPGYPFFITVLYHLFGEHPIVPKITQTLLLALSYVLIPLITTIICGRFSLGFFAVIYLLATNWPMYVYLNTLMTEGFQTFVVTCCGLLFALFHYHKKHHTFFLIALTICLGFSLLIKGTTIFIFPVLFFYYLFKKDLPLPKLKVLTILTFIPLLMAGAWSAYPSKVTGKFVFLNLAHKNTLAKGHGFDMEFKAGLTTKPYTPMEVEHKILGKYLSAPSQFIHRCHEKIKRIITYYHFFFVGLMAYPMISFTRKSTKWYMASLLLIIIIAAQYSSVKMSILYLGCGFLSLISLANTTFTRNHLNTKKTTPLTISTLYAFALFLSLVIVFYPSRRYLAPYAPLMVWPICLWAETIFFNSLQVMKTIIQQKNVLS